MLSKPIKSLETSRVKLSFTGKAMTAYGGFAVLAKLFEKLDLRENIAQIIPFQELSPNSTGVYAKVIRFGLTVLAGGRRFSHTMFLGDSLEIYEAEFAIKRIPKSITAVTRFFGRIKSFQFGERLSSKLWAYLIDKVIPFSEIGSDYLSIDSSVITRYGEQEGAALGYNPKKKGRPSHHPLLAFLNRSKYVVNLWTRSGDTGSGNGALEFLSQTWQRISARIKILGVLCDSGFYRLDLIKFIEGKLTPYVIAARVMAPLQRAIAEIKEWKEVDRNIEVAEFQFQHDKWECKRRYIVVRQRIVLGKRTPSGKQLSLFKEDKNINSYRYGCFITSHTEDPETVWRTYRLRAGDEGIIRENKEDFALDGFSPEKFYAVEAAMLIRILFYNIINLFRSKILPEKEHRLTLHTLRMKYLLIPAVLGRDAKGIILRLGIRAQNAREKIRWIIRRIDDLYPKCNASGLAV